MMLIQQMSLSPLLISFRPLVPRLILLRQELGLELILPMPQVLQEQLQPEQLAERERRRRVVREQEHSIPY